MIGMLGKIETEKILGKALVLQTFRVPSASGRCCDTRVPTTGILHVLFASSLYGALKGDRLAPALLLALNGLGRVAAGLFPCEVGCAGPRVLLSQKLHSLAAGVGFFSLIGASIIGGGVLRRRGLGKMSAYSIISGSLGLVFLLLMSWGAESRAGTRLYERLSSGILSLWVLTLAARLWYLTPSNQGGDG